MSFRCHYDITTNRYRNNAVKFKLNDVNSIICVISQRHRNDIDTASKIHRTLTLNFSKVVGVVSVVGINKILGVLDVEGICEVLGTWCHG